jgi:putative ABC transport system permease protein
VTIVSSGKNWTTTVTGTTNDYFLAGSWRLSSGRTFTDGEERAGKAVCVLGATVTKNLFGTQDPIGNEIRVKNFSCQVIGLFISEGQASMGRDQDDTIIIPLRTLQRRLSGSQDVAEVMVFVNDDRSSELIQRQIAPSCASVATYPTRILRKGNF